MSLEDEIRPFTRTYRGSRPLKAFTREVLGSASQTSSMLNKVARASALWPQLQDKRIPQHTNGLSIQNKRVTTVMTVFVDSNIWIYELGMRQLELLQEWNYLCRQNAQQDLLVDEIIFKLSSKARKQGCTAGYSSQSEDSFGAAVRRRIRLTSAERQDVEKQVSGISDPKLRESVLNAMISVKESKKTSEALENS